MGFSLGPLMARDFSTVLQTLNGFHKNLNFTVYTFEDKKVHILYLLIYKNTTDIF